ncbi:hypothetical protein KFE80_07030 [bacterium SCSIO 12696]|nr:hypothetical protein KFE80_07030 [bacterium SCSIO 12696]
MADISLQCQCGAVKGRATSVSPKSGNHIVCYCSHCQQFMKQLDKQTWLDSNGGSSIFQLAPCRLAITQGSDQLRCLRLTPKGPLRWYTACCHSPVANAFSASMPLVGLITSFIASEAERQELGQVKYFVQGQDAIGTPPHPEVAPKFPGKLIRKIMRQALIGKICGRHKPNPFFTEQGKPVSKPGRLSS